MTQYQSVITLVIKSNNLDELRSISSDIQDMIGKASKGSQNRMHIFLENV